MVQDNESRAWGVSGQLGALELEEGLLEVVKEVVRAKESDWEGLQGAVERFVVEVYWVEIQLHVHFFDCATISAPDAPPFLQQVEADVRQRAGVVKK